MAQVEINYQGLRDLEADFHKQSALSPSFRIFNQDKIKRIYSLNSIRFNIMRDNMEKLITKYVKHGEDGKPVVEDIEGVKRYIFETPEIEAEYKEEALKFLGITFQLNT